MYPTPPAAPSTVVILGCRVIFRGGRLSGTLGRRVRAGALAWRPGDVVVASGGRLWSGEAEASAMARELVALGIPAGAIQRELSSFSTRENAQFVFRIVGRVPIKLVTCESHMPRARGLFERAGMPVVEYPVEEQVAVPHIPRFLEWGKRVLGL